jgi:hypothetical protein
VVVVVFSPLITIQLVVMAAQAALKEHTVVTLAVAVDAAEIDSKRALAEALEPVVLDALVAAVQEDGETLGRMYPEVLVEQVVLLPIPHPHLADYLREPVAAQQVDPVSEAQV